MRKVTLIPLEGAEIEDIGTIRFGQSKAEVLELLKTPSDDLENQLYYDDLELRVDFDAKEKVEFIEIFGPDCEFITPSIYGVNPFEMSVKELTKLLSSKNSGKVDDTESPYAYCYLGSSVGVWRETTEKDIQEMIVEAKKDGEYEDWMEEDLKKAKYFWTVAIGEKDYYKL